MHGFPQALERRTDRSQGPRGRRSCQSDARQDSSRHVIGGVLILLEHGRFVDVIVGSDAVVVCILGEFSNIQRMFRQMFMLKKTM